MTRINRKNAITFVILIGFSILCYIYFVIGHYATDTYAVANLGYREYATQVFLKAGRPFSYLLLIVADLLKIKINVLVSISTILGLLVSCNSVMLLRNTVTKYKKNNNFVTDILLTAISYFTVFNFMYMEDLYFLEASIMCLSTYFYILGAIKLTENNKVDSLKALLYVIIAVFMYNGGISIFIATTVFMLIIKNDINFKKKSKINIFLLSIFFCIIALALNFGQIKIICKIFGFSQNRITIAKSFINNIIYIIKNIGYVLINTAGLFPRYLFLCFLGTIFIVCFMGLTGGNEDEYFPEIIIFTVISIISSFAINVISLSSFGSGRLLINIGMIIGYIYLIIYTKTDIFNNKNIISICLMLILSLYSISNVYNTFSITKDHYKINIIEETEVAKVNEYVSKYEKDNNTKIEYISIKYINDNYLRAFYKRYTSINCIGLYGEASVDGIINFYTGRKLKRIPLTNELNEIFVKKYNDEKITYLCVDNCLICVIFVA